jgi:NIPSNAP protein
MVLMTASVKLYAGKLPDFISLLNDIQPLLAKHGWKLMGSYASIVGRLNTVLDLWELPDPNAVEKALLDPGFQTFIPRIKEIVEDETLSILTKLPIG